MNLQKINLQQIKLLALLLWISNSFAIKNRYSETFLFVRPVYQNLFAYEAFWQDLTYYKGKEPTGSVQMLALYQHSFNTNKPINQYFLMEGKDELTVKGDNVSKFNRDIRAEWLQLPSDFNGSFTLNPENEQFGTLFVIRKDIKHWSCWDLFDNVWIGAYLPIVYSQNKLNLCQSYVEEANTSPHNILEALRAPNFIYNKMINQTDTFGFTELRAMLGARFVTKNSLELYTRSGISFPLGNKYTGCDFFQAIRGFNQHAGFFSALSSQFRINCNDNTKAWFFADFSNIFLFPNTQYRTFDLRNKPYSRYLLMTKNTGETNIPGVNLLTFKVKVKPHNYAQIASGFKIQKGNLQGSLGFGIWAHGNEKIDTGQGFPETSAFAKEDFGISAAPGQVTPQGLPATADKSTIRIQAETDKDKNGNNTFVPIVWQDIDPLSAVTRATFTTSVDFSIGWIHEGPKIGGFLGIGGSMELPQNNAALANWSLWFKVGGSI